MSSQDPPPYDPKTAEVVSEKPPQLNEKIDSPSTSKGDSEKDALSTEEDNESIMKDILSLANNVVKVNESFERVRIGLHAVDETSGDEPKFEEDWIKLQGRWSRLLEESRKISESVDNYIRELIEVIIPSTETSSSEKDIKDLKENLATFVKRSPPIVSSDSQEPGPSPIDTAKHFSQDFTDLQRDLHKFQDTFNRYTKKEEDIAKSLEEVKNAIEENEGLIETLRRGKKKCKAVLGALGGWLSVTTCGIAFAIGAFLFWPAAPVIIMGFGIAGVAVIAWSLILNIICCAFFLIKSNKQSRKLKEKIQELDALRKRLAKLQALKNHMDTQEDDITHIRTQSDSLARIWAEVQHDASVISSQLDTAVSSSKTRSAFKTRLDKVKKQYQRLRDALKGYQAQMTKSRKQADEAKPEVESEKN